MADSKTFHCSIITPERVVLDCEATFVAFPAHDGERGVLRNHAPFVCKLGIGRLHIESSHAGTQPSAGRADERQVLFVDEGFVQIVENQLTILTQAAQTPEEIDRGAAEQAMVEARCDEHH